MNFIKSNKISKNEIAFGGRRKKGRGRGRLARFKELEVLETKGMREIFMFLYVSMSRKTDSFDLVREVKSILTKMGNFLKLPVF